MRTSILSKSISIITGLALIAPIAHADGDSKFKIESVTGDQSTCAQYFVSGRKVDYGLLKGYQQAASDGGAAKADNDALATKVANDGDGKIDSTAHTQAAATAIDACLKQTGFYIEQIKKCNVPAYKLSSGIQEATEYATKVQTACSGDAEQLNGQIQARGPIDNKAEVTQGGPKEPGALARTGGFLKNNLVPIGLGAAVGLGAYFLMKDKDDGKREPASETPPPDTTPPAVDPPLDLTIDAPTDSLTQSELLAKIPTEQTSPVTASANATEFDPAYTGKGADLGDTSGLRDESAGDTVSGFKCMVGESDAACRARYACTKDEAMSTCQARWDSGQVALK